MEKLNNAQTKDRIAAMLRQEILSGRIEDGSELTQEQIAEQLEVSRMPVREAFQILELEGLLLRLPNRHMQVVGFRADSVREDMRVLAAVESEIACIVVGAGKHAVVPDSFQEQDFHTRLSDLTGNHYLCQFHRRLLGGYPQYIWDNLPDNAEREELLQHIAAAIQAADIPLIYLQLQRYYRALAETLILHTEEVHKDEKPATH